MMTPLYAGVFLACTGCSIALIGAPWLAKDWGTNELELGVLMSGAMVWLVVLCPVAGCAAERWGSGWLVRFALILSAASLLLMSRCHTLSTLIVTLSLFGLSQALYWPAVEVQLAFGAGGNELARRIGAFNIAWGAGAALGGWLTGALYSVAPPLTFVVGAILFAAAWVVTERALRALPLAVVKSQESRVKSQESRVKTQDSSMQAGQPTSRAGSVLKVPKPCCPRWRGRCMWATCSGEW